MRFLGFPLLLSYEEKGIRIICNKCNSLLDHWQRLLTIQLQKWPIDTLVAADSNEGYLQRLYDFRRIRAIPLNEPKSFDEPRRVSFFCLIDSRGQDRVCLQCLHFLRARQGQEITEPSPYQAQAWKKFENNPNKSQLRSFPLARSISRLVPKSTYSEDWVHYNSIPN